MVAVLDVPVCYVLAGLALWIQEFAHSAFRFQYLTLWPRAHWEFNDPLNYVRVFGQVRDEAINMVAMCFI